jgi:hypothetical protein
VTRPAPMVGRPRAFRSIRSWMGGLPGCPWRGAVSCGERQPDPG